MTEYLESDGGRIAYEIHGEHGPLIVAIPGMGDVRGVYRFLDDRLAGDGYRFVAVDPRGMGESSTDWEEFSDAAVAGDILRLIEHLGGPAVVVGNSFSAGSAVIAATDRSDLVSAIVLIGPFVHTVEIPAWMGWAFKLMLAGPWGRRVWVRYYRTRMYPGTVPPDLDRYVGSLASNLAEPGRMEAFRGFASDSHGDSGSRLDRVDVPVLVFMGSADPDFPDPAAEAELLGRRLGATVEIVDGAGHYPQAEQPGRVAEAMSSFLEKIRA